MQEEMKSHTCVREHRGTWGTQGNMGNTREHWGTQGNTGEHKGTLGNTREHWGTQGNTREHRGTQGNMGNTREHRETEEYKGTQGNTGTWRTQGNMGNMEGRAHFTSRYYFSMPSISTVRIKYLYLCVLVPSPLLRLASPFSTMLAHWEMMSLWPSCSRNIRVTWVLLIR